MQMPGFTAGASLYKAEGHYYTLGTSNQVRAAILPALGAGDGGDCLDNCISNVCDNLDGAAYQRCVTRCGHQCFPAGGVAPPPLTQAQCNQNYAACGANCNFNPFTPFPINLGCVHDCDTALCNCLIATGTLPPGVINCGF
jgi:hypothetical protein